MRTVRKNEVERWLFFVFLFVFATSPDPFLSEVDDRNYFLIAFMPASLILLLLYRRFFYSDLICILFILSILISGFVVNFASARFSTIAYTVFFALTFMSFVRSVHMAKLDYFWLMQCTKLIMTSYLVILIVQQFTVLLNLPVFIAGNYNPAYPWKLSSLAAEPSHASLVLTLLMFCTVRMREEVDRTKYGISDAVKKDYVLWGGYVWFVFTAYSATAFILFFLFLGYFLRPRSVLFVVPTIGLIAFISYQLQIPTFLRAFNFLEALLTFDIKAILSADHSGSYRIIPALLVAQNVSFFDLTGIFGNGSDFVASFLHWEIPGTPEGYTTGGLITLWAEYGLIAFLLFILMTLHCIQGERKIFTLVFAFIFLFLGNGINTQLVWLFLMISYSMSFVTKQRYR